MPLQNSQTNNIFRIISHPYDHLWHSFSAGFLKIIGTAIFKIAILGINFFLYIPAVESS
jgi:hypothetical protein